MCIRSIISDAKKTEQSDFTDNRICIFKKKRGGGGGSSSHNENVA